MSGKVYLWYSRPGYLSYRVQVPEGQEWQEPVIRGFDWRKEWGSPLTVVPPDFSEEFDLDERPEGSYRVGVAFRVADLPIRWAWSPTMEGGGGK